ncbi:hypothetical protein EON65_31975 [archaeon]|nr:MAG: hypothetical protein EON65_31975 [archaeon]
MMKLYFTCYYSPLCFFIATFLHIFISLTILHPPIPGKGTGGHSAFPHKQFRDEFDTRLLHNVRGILSMANSGQHTNASQFFITFAPAQHLDFKHPVFGKVVGGLAALDRMEQVEIITNVCFCDAKANALFSLLLDVPTNLYSCTCKQVGADSKDRPLEEIKILSAAVFSDPLDEADNMLEEFIRENMKRRLSNVVKPALPSAGNGGEGDDSRPTKQVKYSHST